MGRNTTRKLAFVLVLLIVGTFVIACTYELGHNQAIVAETSITGRLSASVVMVLSSTVTVINSVLHSPPAPGTYGPVGKAYGIAAGSILTSLSQADLDQEFSGMSAAGVKWVRLDFNWSAVQYANANSYDWSGLDRVVADANRYHIQVLGIIDYAPPWARSSACASIEVCPPGNDAQFSTFAGQVAARYSKQGVHYWEIWNEPNSAGFWPPAANVKAYKALLIPAYTAIKNADSYATVLTGGMAPESTDGSNLSPTDFLTGLYQNGGRNYFDDVADHPYTYPLLPTSGNALAWKQMASTTPSLRSIMVANKDSAKKIWITEVGAPTNGPDSRWYVSEEAQAQLLNADVSLYKTYDWVGPLFWYSYRDSGTVANTNESFFGIVRNDYSQKPAYAVFKGLLTDTATAQ